MHSYVKTSARLYYVQRTCVHEEGKLAPELWFTRFQRRTEMSLGSNDPMDLESIDADQFSLIYNRSEEPWIATCLTESVYHIIAISERPLLVLRFPASFPSHGCY